MSMCRLCTEEKPLFDIIYEINDEHPEFLEMLNKIFSVTISEDDGLPQGICQRCKDQVLSIIEFRCLVQSSQEKLQDLKDTIEIFTKEEEECNTESPVAMCEEYLLNDEEEPIKPESCNKSQQIVVLQKPKQRKKYTEESTTSITDEEIRDFFDLSCKMCDDTVKLSTFDELKSHMVNSHQTAAFVECCGKRFRSRYNLAFHLQVHRNPGLVTCQLCNKQLRDLYSLEYHNKRYHLNAIQCEICSKNFGSFQKLEQHKILHLPAEEKEKFKIHVCTDCPKRFLTKVELELHTRAMHRDKTGTEIICEICGKTFARRDHLKYHSRIHTDAERVECDVCHAKLANKDVLRAHMRRNHVQAGTFVCSECGKESFNLHAHKGHIQRVHTDQNVFKCEYCEKAFKTKLRWREHTAQHTGVALYSCQFCDRTSNSNANMYNHKKIHHPKELAALKAQKTKLK